jgi:hypothetical protein
MHDFDFPCLSPRSNVMIEKMIVAPELSPAMTNDKAF